jgi:hypothetical protein
MKCLPTTTQRPARASWRGGQPLLVNPGIGSLLNHLNSSSNSLRNLLADLLANLARHQGSGYLFSSLSMVDVVAHPSVDRPQFNCPQIADLQQDLPIDAPVESRVEQREQIKTKQPYRSGRCRFSLAPM